MLGNATRWREAMNRMGRIAVEAELRSRPGRPTDRVLDIGNEPPYPTREFCQQWCTEQDNILFRFSPRVGVVLTLFAIMLVSLLQLFGSIGNAPAGSGARPMMAGADTPRSRGAAQGLQSVPGYQPVTAPRPLPLPSTQPLSSAAQQNAGTAGSSAPSAAFSSP
jgi:hypothetical protein